MDGQLSVDGWCQWKDHFYMMIPLSQWMDGLLSVDGWCQWKDHFYNLYDHSTESVERSQKCTNVDSTDSVESTSSFLRSLYDFFFKNISYHGS